MKKLIWILIFGTVVSGGYAQKKNNFKIGVEFGQGSVEGDYKDKWNIRQDVDAYLYDHGMFGSRAAYAQSDFLYFGIKPQISLWNNRVNLYSGLRFTIYDGNLGDKSGKNFFYFRTANPDAVEFYKISLIKEKTGYLSIPLEMSYNIFHSSILTPNMTVSVYGKAGAEIGLSILSKRNVNFVSATMQSHENEVLSSVEKTDNFYSTFYGAIGGQLTVGNGMQFNVEGIIPSQILTKNHSSIIEPDTFSGIQLSVQFPLSMFIKNN